MNPLISLLLWSHLVPTAPPVIPEPIDTLVVCAPSFRAELQPWIDYRSRQLHRIGVTTDTQSAERIRAAIQRAALGGSLRSVVLVGDVRHDAEQSGQHVAVCVVPAVINQRYGSEAEIASDHGYGDLDGDSIPELAVGRLPVDHPEQLRVVIQKIIDYEQRASLDAWRQRINLIAGVGGFGALTDTVLETTVRSCITRGIPPEFRTSMTYASWRSPYCPDPRSFRRATLERLNEGCFCWVYIGHGQRQGLDLVRVPTGVAPIMTLRDVERVDCPQGHPIAVFLSCYAGAFDGRDDCLAESLILQERGPIAAIAASRVAMPYGMGVFSQALMRQMFSVRPTTLGEVVLHAKQQLATTKEDGSSEHPWMDTAARMLNPQSRDLAAERREHAWLFNLLGDPLLRLRHPEEIKIDVPSSVVAGKPLLVRWRGAMPGDCLIELTSRRGRLTFTPASRPQFDGSHEGMLALNDVYERANDDRFSMQRVIAKGAESETRLDVPASAAGACVVRVFVRGAQTFAMGATSVYVSSADESKKADGEASSTDAATGDAPALLDEPR